MSLRAEYPVIASATLAGSLLSCFATSCVLISFVIYRHQMSSFRHALVLNLSLAEFVNSLNNSVSGIIFVRTGELQRGTACTMNGMIGQLSVQAGDFSILAIAVVTLLTVTRTAYLPDASILKKTAICFAVWIVPIVTSVTATVMGEMTTVGGNWCWISAQRPDLRYGLTHGWRFAIIFSTIGIYLYIWVHLRNHFKSVRGAQRWTYHQTTSETSSFATTIAKGRTSETGRDGSIELGSVPQPSRVTFDLPARSAETLVEQGHLPAPRPAYKSDGADIDDDDATLDEMMYDRPARSLRQQRSIAEDMRRIEPPVPYHDSSQRPLHKMDSHGGPIVTATMRTSVSEFPIRRESRQAEREIKRMMLLNAYPIMYILLWIPGIINRLMEASGNPPSPRLAGSLQVSTQFVGFANALTYGFNHHLRDRLKDMYVTGLVSRFKGRRR